MTPAVGVVSAEDRAAVTASVAAVLDGARPAEDDRFRATDDAEGRFVRALAAEAAAQLEGKPAQRILAWAAAVVPRFAVTSSFGAESAVLLHMVSQVAPDVPVLFLDTDFHFSETIDYRRRLAVELGVTVVDVRPALSPAQQEARLGARLFDRDPDRCCGLRKTEPLRRALTSYDGWATGVRRVQTPERSATPVVEARSHDDRWLVKVAPLADWTDADVADYLRCHDLPRHPLVAAGYRSIGCAPCTLPVAAADDPRAGRWSAFAKTECGLHLPGDGVTDRVTTTPG
ncbi:MAG TPA: phosphoadenylyl-sulfate reductase [Egibacteraceae bacterium]|nr:phosphoadenylyl-sulfate reductase [Egibacteraceae bacterium]